MANKVEFGISELHVGTWTESGGTITLGTPYHQKGAVSFAPEVNESQNNFYADNIVYWSGYSGGTIEGDLEVAMFDDKCIVAHSAEITADDFLNCSISTHQIIGNCRTDTIYPHISWRFIEFFWRHDSTANSLNYWENLNIAIVVYCCFAVCLQIKWVNHIYIT